MQTEAKQIREDERVACDLHDGCSTQIHLLGIKDSFEGSRLAYLSRWAILWFYFTATFSLIV